jgi:hypothetical protein
MDANKTARIEFLFEFGNGHIQHIVRSRVAANVSLSREKKWVMRRISIGSSLSPVRDAIRSSHGLFTNAGTR